MLDELRKDLEVQKSIVAQTKDKVCREEIRQNLLGNLVALGDIKRDVTAQLVISNGRIRLSISEGYGGSPWPTVDIPITPEQRVIIADLITEMALVKE